MTARPPHPLPGTLVLGGTYRALGVVRSLGRRGIPVRVVLTDDHVIAAFSRYACGGRRLRLPTASEADQARWLQGLARDDGRAWTVVPTDDESAALVARRRDELAEHLLLTTPGWETLRHADDKRLTHQLGLDAGVPVPGQWLPSDADELAALAPDFPVILKPATKQAGDPLSVAKAWRVDDARALAERYAEARRSLPAQTIMVQELIPGDSASTQLSFGAICRDGEVLGSITARRTRQRPMDFGKASTYVETIAHAGVRELGERVLRHLRWTGVAEVEFKRDPRDDQLKLLDVNPRTWGWQSLGAAAGVDFPYLEWRQAQGLPIEVVHARPGVRWVRATMDLPTVLEEVRGGRLAARAAARSYRPPVAWAMWAPDDPVPALLDVPALAAVAARRRRGR